MTPLPRTTNLGTPLPITTSLPTISLSVPSPASVPNPPPSPFKEAEEREIALRELSISVMSQAAACGSSTLKSSLMGSPRLFLLLCALLDKYCKNDGDAIQRNSRLGKDGVEQRIGEESYELLECLAKSHSSRLSHLNPIATHMFISSLSSGRHSSQIFLDMLSTCHESLV
eukprot:TRINITY_DN6380_c0_g1_i1.p1 TRINITY_DN6380_c0_g1~~TRINITY_DN6380_c0_g1_i1.p1  ORF type:complete len:171 (+),score=39.82 TRINITY_DN6380_c0_g1_i1:292-804(+)